MQVCCSTGRRVEDAYLVWSGLVAFLRNQRTLHRAGEHMAHPQPARPAAPARRRRCGRGTRCSCAAASPGRSCPRCGGTPGPWGCWCAARRHSCRGRRQGPHALTQIHPHGLAKGKTSLHVKPGRRPLPGNLSASRQAHTLEAIPSINRLKKPRLAHPMYSSSSATLSNLSPSRSEHSSRIDLMSCRSCSA